jgi:hypothetical protein
VNPLDFLDLAEELAGRDDEAARRTAVGRFYYAVFLQCRAEVAKRVVPPRGARIHQWVANQPREENPQRAAFLHELRSHRNVADYDIEVEFLPSIVDRAARLAERILNSAEAR